MGECEKKAAPSLKQIVYEDLKRKIITCEIMPGAQLTEEALCEQLNASRTPVREALKQLERENLVVALPNRGVMVRGMSSEDMSDIYTIRALLEGLAAYWAAERSSAEQLDQMLEVLELMEIYTRRNDVARLVRLDSKFHGIIYDGCRSSTIGKLLDNIHHVIHTRRTTSYNKEGRAAASLEEHRAIYEALVARDAERAKACAEHHIQMALQVTGKN